MFKGLTKLVSKGRKEGKKKEMKARDNEGKEEKEWYMRWEYEETPSEEWRGIIFSPSPSDRTGSGDATDSQHPEEVTLTQIMKYYKPFDGGKSLIGVIGSCVFTHTQLARGSYKNVGVQRMHFLGDPEGSMEVLVLDPKTTGQLRHKNIARVFGWCEDRETQTFSVVHEPLSNGTLYSHLHFPHLVGSTLPWQERYDIACGLASGIRHLNEEQLEFGLALHTEINSRNVFLDSDLNAKLVNMGTFKFEGESSSSSTTALVMGTSCCSTFRSRDEKHSREANVCCFGNVALEIACGLDPVALVQDQSTTIWGHVMGFYARGELLEAADPKLKRNFGKEKMERLMLVGIWCAQPDPNSRPSITQVVKYLHFDSPVPSQLPTRTMHSFLKTYKPVEMKPTTIDDDVDRSPSNYSKDDSGDYGHVRDDMDKSSSATQASNPNPSSSSGDQEKAAFDIGIPVNYKGSNEPLKDFQLQVVKRMVASLHQSFEKELQFEKTLELVRKYTQVLVALDIPLDNWSFLVQDLLRVAKLIDQLRKGSGEVATMAGYSDLKTVELSAFREEIERCERRIQEQEEEQGKLLLKRVELQKQMLDLQEEMRDVDEKLELVARRTAQEAQVRDQNKKELEVLGLYQSVLSKVSRFSCEE